MRTLLPVLNSHNSSMFFISRVCLTYDTVNLQRWAGLPILFGGWSLSFYIVYMVWKNFTLLLLQYQKFIAAYFATVTLISFAICYRYGPPTDVRSHNLAQWALQSIALVLIYFSCQVYLIKRCADHSIVILP